MNAENDEHVPVWTYVEDSGVGKRLMTLCSCSEYHLGRIVPHGQSAEKDAPPCTCTHSHPSAPDAKHGPFCPRRARVIPPGLREPPEGWYTFGTHVDVPVRLEFSEETDEALMPLWERPIPPANGDSDD